MLSLYGDPFHEVTIGFSWNDTRMSASMESILGGYDDPRAPKYWSPVADASLVADHPTFPYKGIRNGAYLASKALHLPYSNISEDFKSASDRKLVDAAEVHFALAEANLRGPKPTRTCRPRRACPRRRPRRSGRRPRPAVASSCSPSRWPQPPPWRVRRAGASGVTARTQP